ncbi:Rieske (2Fe-2S) protein [Oceanicoccus sagamiensis]|uniref:Rieske (2Fe-2S) protein n=1 Tax=Oceanicoccus sagamiensis TaxID=716816 RepID=A0A1X9NLT7_9GAMM|nr:Rieske (2Fe-2S) protein [Oceanicoccus sagamiensis]ARN75797.1 Rieske (2Fe-2S) protein [Oceanicoccus sagamiensis]
MRFYSLDKLINLHDGYRKVFKIDLYNLILLQVAGERYLLESTCPHRGHPISESDIDGSRLRCSLHGYQFDIATGELMVATEAPCRGLKTYELIYQGTEIGVML